ncbi:MAG: M15 family metallopeptidase [Oscillospiraceae bacterium]|nr:M15 family metallopeptidase [Oscillospiraceae bacterium]
MKKIRRIAAAVLAAAIIINFSSCVFVESIGEIDGETSGTTEPFSIPSSEEQTSSEPGSAFSEISSSEGTTLEGGAVVIGVTSKGYEIIDIDGITYINGILIVNKTYSVPQSYAPGDLTPECKEAFNKLVKAAAADGLNIFVQSGYRSYETQRGLYNRYCERDGKERADTYSARPGYSEHQTGLAIDVNSVSRSFAGTPEGKWIAGNSYKYGFIVRYGQEKESLTGYSYEPWHIRYVGVAMAQAIYDSGLCLEEYLGISSVYA